MLNVDKISKQVLQYLLNCPDCTFSVNKGFPSNIPTEELLSSIDFLEKEGYLTTSRVPSGALISATLTHKGKHPKEFNSIALKRYLLDKWVDILALIISILAFIGAYRVEISALLRLLMQGLTR
jgi:hypothetical protein